MKVFVSIQWKPPDFDKRLARYPEVLAEMHRKIGSGAGALIESGVKRDITEKGLVNTGRLRSSVRWRIQDPKTTVVEAATEYAEYQDVGAGPSRAAPGPRKRFWPPRDAIEYWVKRKGIHKKMGVSLSRATYLVQRAIWRRGIKPKFFMKGGLERSWNKVQRLVREVQKDILRRLGFE